MDCHPELMVNMLFRVPGSGNVKVEEWRQAMRVATHAPQHRGSSSQMIDNVVSGHPSGSEGDNILSSWQVAE